MHRAMSLPSFCVTSLFEMCGGQVEAAGGVSALIKLLACDKPAEEVLKPTSKVQNNTCVHAW